MFKIKRVYEPAAKADGFRVLVDRLWPRGLTKAKAGVDLWLKEIAPSNDLRKSFGHDPEKWGEFRRRYGQELSRNPDLIAQLRHLEREHGTITLLFGAKDETHNNAVALAQRLTERR